MKRQAKILMIALCVGIAATMTCKCQKSVVQEGPSNRLIPEISDGKTSSNYLMMVFIGHDGRNCQGCLLIGGKLMHIDCQGYGSLCRITPSVTLNQSGTDITATTTDTFGLTSENFFLMPDRSLNYTDEHNNRIFLNIPGQLVFRDTTTQQFTFTGLFFSDRAAYSND